MYTEDIKTIKEHVWNYLVNKKVLKNAEYDLYDTTKDTRTHT